MPESSDPKAIQVTYSEAFPDILTAVDKVDRPGSYLASGVCETPIPSIRVAGGEPLSIPVPAAQAKAVIKTAGEKAPYGRGEDTLLDESVRRVWQVSPKQVKITGKGWTNTFRQIVTDVAHGLGCDDGSVTAEFYKLLVYEKGGFFKAHRDSEKADGMFGTLIVVLPSAHKGGELTVRHAGRETVVDLSGAAPSKVKWASFYADCEHEVARIRSGYRICLVYNLVRRSSASNAVPDNRPAAGEIAADLLDWRKRYGRENVPEKLVYLLEHHYTPAGLTFGNLKNRDDALARAFLAAGQDAGCSIHLGIVHIEEDGWAEYSGGYHSYRGRWYDDDDEDEDSDDFEIGEVCNWNYSISDWIDVDGASVGFGEVPLSGNELLPPGALDDAVPDKIHFSEATGNEGASFERTYLRAAVVIWPDEAADQICLSAGLEAGVARLGKWATDAANGSTTNTAFARFAKLLCMGWKPDPCRTLKNTVGDPIRILTDHGDSKLLADCLNALLPAQFGKGEENETIAKAVVDVKPAEAGKILTAIFAKHTKSACAATLDLWSRVATHAEGNSAPTWLKQSLEILLEHLPKAKGNKAPSTLGRSRYWSRRYHVDFDFNDDEEDASNTSRVPKLNVETLATWLLLIDECCPDRFANKAVEALCVNTGGFPPDTLLAPCITELQKAGFPSRQLDRLWDHCGRFLARRSPRPPAPPKDWKQTAPARWKCNCKDCGVLRPYVSDPDTQTLRMPMAKARRMHIHRIIDDNGLDMTHETERKGSPYTLACTKTRSAYKKKCKRHVADVKVMKQLEKLSDLAVSPAAVEALEKVHKAVRAANS